MKSELAFCQTFTILHYYTAAEYNIAVIEHNVLSRSYRSYLFIKHDPDRISALRIYGTRLFGLPVTCLCPAFKLAFGIFKRYPVKIICIQRIGKKKLVTAERYGIIIGIFPITYIGLPNPVPIPLLCPIVQNITPLCLPITLPFSSRKSPSG